jgi:hypothetical protein
MEKSTSQDLVLGSQQEHLQTSKALTPTGAMITGPATPSVRASEYRSPVEHWHRAYEEFLAAYNSALRAGASPQHVALGLSAREIAELMRREKNRLIQEGSRLGEQIVQGMPCFRFEIITVPVDPRQAAPCEVVPIWDGRLLVYDGQLVKRFERAAPFQTIALDVWQKSKWCQRIGDPFDWDPDVDPRERLHNVCTRLNGNQVNNLLHFYRDGKGKGLCWEPMRQS